MKSGKKKKRSRSEKGKKSWSFEEWEKINYQDPKREKNHNLKVKQSGNSWQNLEE